MGPKNFEQSIESSNNFLHEKFQSRKGGESSVGKKSRLWILISTVYSFLTMSVKKVYSSSLLLIKGSSLLGQSKSSTNNVANSILLLQRNLNCQKLTKNLELITKEQDKSSSTTTSVNQSSGQPPLCVLMSWMLSKKKHLMNYANIYLDKGFDVLTVRCDMTQYMFPSSGSGAQVVAKDLIKFLTENPQYERMTMVHGFSGSAYFWGEILTLLNREPEKYQKLLDGWIVGQVWDSPAGFAEIAPTFGTAVFPKSWLLQNIMRIYAELHLKFLYEQATKHYNVARSNYENTRIRCPSLFLCSENDPISLYSYVQTVAKKWTANGMDVRLRSWKESPHVSHMWSHPEDYREELDNFIQKLDLTKSTGSSSSPTSRL